MDLWALTLTGVPLRVEVVTMVTVAHVAAQAVHTLAVTTQVPAEPALIRLRFRKETQASYTHICTYIYINIYIYIYIYIYRNIYICVCVCVCDNVSVFLYTSGAHHLTYHSCSGDQYVCESERERERERERVQNCHVSIK